MFAHLYEQRRRPNDDDPLHRHAVDDPNTTEKDNDTSF
jgi:hypothetical protein